MEKFKNLYTISKTLRFGLKPIGKTLENIEKMGFIEEDRYKADNRKIIQNIIDDKLKKIIDARLDSLSLREELLEEVFSEDVKVRENALMKLKQQIANIFKKDTQRKEYMDAGKHLKNLKKEYEQKEGCLEKDLIEKFDNFSTYFTNFYDIREYVLTGDSSGSIAYRLIDENLKTYNNNVEKIKRLPEELKCDLKDINKIENLVSYNNFLTNAGIIEYNEILGGISSEDGTKIQGINEKINLYSQQKNVKLPKLDQLFKMILSDRESSSFIPSAVKDDKELLKMLKELIEKTKLDKNILLEETNAIFIKYNQLGNLPGISYALITEKIVDDYDIRYGTGKRNKSYEDDRRKEIESDMYSIDKIVILLDKTDINPIQNIKQKHEELINNYENTKEGFLKEDWTIIDNIKQSKKINVIKAIFDSLKDIQRFYSMFEMVDEDKKPSPSFYNWLSVNKDILGIEFNAIYNKTRNYLTKKQYSSEKYKLNFNSPTLAKGWDTNKEIDNSAFILRKFNQERKEYDLFLGIWEKSLSKKEKVTPHSTDGDYEKMQYKLYPDPSKMMPKQFLSAKWNEIYPINEEFKANYEAGRHKKGENFDKRFLHELIERFKHGLINHEEKYQETFGFKFRETNKYEAYTEFIQDVEKNNYNVSFNRVKDIEKLVNDGKLYLFQIWSKDFSTFSKGTKNLNTIYFESLFSDKNLESNIFKLSGEAELFYRPSSIKYDKDTLKKGHHYEELKDKFEYPIVKDRRYCEDKFMFHVPIQINFRSEKVSAKNLNERVNKNIEQFTHVIGIDRGERHLVYISVVEVKTGKIVEQKHLDEIINIDSKGNSHETSYLKKLDKMAKTRDNERKSWETIETIKELKDGYISQAVNEICKLQKKYNAIIVMENLNDGFKRTRFKVEKQVYQKFEIALIKKLNYVIDKKDAKTYLHGYQLTNPITTLDKIGSQSGIIFYIPAWNTSKIDPITGFVNLLNAKYLRYQNREKTDEFIDKIDKIYYEDGEFKFDVDFGKWNKRYVNSRTKWTLTSYGKRIITFRNPKANNMWCCEEIDLTQEFDKILNKEDGKLKSSDASNYKRFMQLFKLMLQIRNSETGTDNDYLISPVAGTNGLHFDSREVGKALAETLPKDADANGAYNIARKGLMAIENIKKDIKNPLRITNEDYLIYMQN